MAMYRDAPRPQPVSSPLSPPVANIQTLWDYDVAYHETIDDLLQPLCASCDLGCIPTCMEDRNESALSLDRLKITYDIVNRAVDPDWNQIRLTRA